MASRLSFTAYYTRQTIKWFGIGVVIYIILYIAWIIIKPLIARPPPPPPIVPTFGGLPAPDFPPPDPAVTFKYKLETINGSLPADFPDRVTVYKNTTSVPNFFSLDNAKKTAAALKFQTNPIPVAPPLYQWKQIVGLPGLLEMNITNQTIDLVLNWRVDQTLLQTNKRMLETEAFKTAQGGISNAKLLNDQVKKGDHSFIFYKIVNGQLVKVPAISEADIVQVNFRQAAINKLPVVAPDPERPPIWGLVTRNRQLVEIHIHYYPTGGESSEYPLRPVLDAWQDLLNGKGHVARLGDNLPGQEVIIRQFSLAYYIPDHFQDFSQPVYVIQGDNNFMALVRAIDPQAGTKKK